MAGAFIPVGWVETFAKPIIFLSPFDGYMLPTINPTGRLI